MRHPRRSWAFALTSFIGRIGGALSYDAPRFLRAAELAMMIDPEKAQLLSHRLLAWWDTHGRKSLPWQQNPTPYRVWVSEVMLQQTQVATVIPYYERFISRFPTARALAQAPEDEVLHLWTGLGYYARARNLLRCAKVLVERHDAEFPADIDAVTALPGIGRSTAGAILALSGDQRHPILDGNAKRVLARVFAIEGDPSDAGVLKTLWSAAENCTPHVRAGHYTQAIMDLGATLCTRTRPACTVCPLVEICVAAREGRQPELPGIKQRRERPSRGLWSPPQFLNEAEALAWCRRELGAVEDMEPLPPIDHGFTHFHLRLQPLRVRFTPSSQVREAGDRIWYALSSPPKVGLPRPIHQLFERMLNA
jgi:A/G-specific adenine glycosylase